MAGMTPGLVVPNAIRKQAEQVKREQVISKQHSSIVSGLVPAFRFQSLFPLMMNMEV